MTHFNECIYDDGIHCSFQCCYHGHIFNGEVQKMEDCVCGGKRQNWRLDYGDRCERRLQWTGGHVLTAHENAAHSHDLPNYEQWQHGQEEEQFIFWIGPPETPLLLWPALPLEARLVSVDWVLLPQAMLNPGVHKEACGLGCHFGYHCVCHVDVQVLVHDPSFLRGHANVWGLCCRLCPGWYLWPVQFPKAMLIRGTSAATWGHGDVHNLCCLRGSCLGLWFCCSQGLCWCLWPALPPKAKIPWSLLPSEPMLRFVG